MKIYVEPFLMSIEDAVRTAKKYNIGLELQLNAKRVKLLNSKQGETIIEKIKEVESLSIHGPVHDLPIGAEDPYIVNAVKERFKDTLELSIKLNAKWVLFHLGYNPLEYWHPNALNSWIERAISFINQFFGKYRNVKIHLENAFEPDPEIFKKILENSPNNVSLCLDIGHAFVYSNRSLEEWIDLLAPFISEVHIHNNDGRKDLHQPLSEGKIDVKKILSLIEKNVNDYVITLEPTSEKNLVIDLKWLKDNKII